jgi:hypothetical protein
MSMKPLQYGEKTIFEWSMHALLDDDTAELAVSHSVAVAQVSHLNT